MFLAIGIALLLVSLVIIAAIIFTTARSVKESGELVISKKSLLYLVPTFVLVFFLHVAGSVYNGDSLDFFGCFGDALFALCIKAGRADHHSDSVCLTNRQKRKRGLRTSEINQDIGLGKFCGIRRNQDPRGFAECGTGVCTDFNRTGSGQSGNQF